MPWLRMPPPLCAAAAGERQSAERGCHARLHREQAEAAVACDRQRARRRARSTFTGAFVLVNTSVPSCVGEVDRLRRAEDRRIEENRVGARAAGQPGCCWPTRPPTGASRRASESPVLVTR